MKDSFLYEINYRVWHRKKYGVNSNKKISDIPDEFIDNLKSFGIDFLWLMGVWKTNLNSVKKYCFEQNLVHSYQRTLKAFTPEDVVGSPYAIEEYVLNPEFGDESNLLVLKEKLNRNGIKLILDFVPNHFAAETKLIERYPEIFLEVGEEIFLKDSYTFFSPEATPKKYFAHGRDPFYPPWLDTIQVNFFSKQAREYLIDILKKLSTLCDGVRCDMAMLALNNVFYNTWGSAIKNTNSFSIQREFWEEAIEKIKRINSDFIFIGEVYWNLEYDLQKLGFDYTYDKRLYDRLKFSDATNINAHLKADKEYQKKLVRFIENHDEERAMRVFGKDKSFAAAVIIGALPGMKLFYDGQFEGKTVKLPVQLIREPIEQENKKTLEFYYNLLNIYKDPLFKDGEWKLIEAEPSWHNNFTYKNFIACQRTYKNKNALIITNYSDIQSQCRVKLNLYNYGEAIELNDVLNKVKYLRSVEEIHHIGLYVELKPFSSHIFIY